LGWTGTGTDLAIAAHGHAGDPRSNMILILEEQEMPAQKEQKMLVRKEPKMLVARIILAVMALNLLFLFAELTMNVVRVYFG
jgi:hypothetical protein